MNDKLLAQLRGKAPPPGAPVLVKSGDEAPPEDDPDEVREGCCGFLRGIRDRAFAIEFRLLGSNPYPEESPAGHYALFSYCAWLRDATGFRLEYMNGLKITVTGRGLRRIYERILQSRLLWLQEEGRDAIAGRADPEAPRIYAINVERRTDPAAA